MRNAAYLTSLVVVWVIGCGDSDEVSTALPVLLQELDATPGCFSERPPNPSELENQTEELILVGVAETLELFRGDLEPVRADPTAASWSSARATVIPTEREEGFGTLRVVQSGSGFTYDVRYDGEATSFVPDRVELVQRTNALEVIGASLGCAPTTGISFFSTAQSSRCWETDGAPVEGVLRCEAAKSDALNTQI